MTLALKVSTNKEAGGRVVGAAFADVSARSLGLAQFADNDVFSNAESLIIQLGVKEAIITDDLSGKDYDLAKIEVMLERCGVVTTKVRSSACLLLRALSCAHGSCRALTLDSRFDVLADFNPKNVEQDLGRLLKGKPEQAAGESPTTTADSPSRLTDSDLAILAARSSQLNSP